MKKLKIPVVFCFLILASLAGCKRTNGVFTTQKWLEGDGLKFPLRDELLDDLVQHHKLKGVKYNEIQHLLGYPDGQDSESFYYQVVETLTNMHKPEHIKKLVFYMGKDSVITRFEVYDKTFKK